MANSGVNIPYGSKKTHSDLLPVYLDPEPVGLQPLSLRSGRVLWKTPFHCQGLFGNVVLNTFY